MECRQSLQRGRPQDGKGIYLGHEADLSIAKRNPDVTYFNNGENWFVQSGYNNNGEEIFYSKERLTDSGLKTFWITNSTAKREFGDSITAEFEKNFSFWPIRLIKATNQFISMITFWKTRQR